MADLTVRVKAITGEAQRGLASVARHITAVRAAALKAGPTLAKGYGWLEVGTMALAASAQVASLSVAISRVAGAAVVLPGLLAGAADAGAGLGLALKDAGTRLADLGPRFQAVQQAASVNFWARAEGPVRSLAASALPGLTRAMATTGAAWGSWAATVSTSLQRLRVGSAIAGVGQEVAGAIRIAQGGVPGMLTALGQIGSVGVTYIRPLAQWITDLSNRFSAFIAKASASGQLAAWAQSGISTLGQLGRIVGDVARLAGTLLGSMAQFGGAGSLSPLIAILEKANTALAGPIGQNLLAQIFGAAQQAMTNLGPAFSALGTALVALGPVIAQLLPVAASLVSEVFAALAPVIVDLSKALAPLIPQIGAELTQAVRDIAPILQGMAHFLAENHDIILPLAGIIGAVVVAQWAWNIAMTANPIGLIIAGIIALIAGIVLLVKNWDKVKETVDNVVRSIIDWFSSLPRKVGNIGTQIIQGIIDGISRNAKALWDTLTNIGNGIPQSLRSALRIASPSKVTAEIGRWTGLGLAEGLRSTASLVSAAGATLATAAVPDVPPAVLNVSAGSAAGGTAAGAGPITININGHVLGNEHELARVIRSALNADARTSGRVSVGGMAL